MGLSNDDRIKVHARLANLVLEFVSKHHQSISAKSTEDDTLKCFHTCNVQLSAATVLPRPLHRPPTRRTPCWSLLQTHPHLAVHFLRSARQMAAPLTSRRTHHREAFNHPIVVVVFGAARCPQHARRGDPALQLDKFPDALLLQAGSHTSTPPSLTKWANHSTRLNGNKRLDPLATHLQQARHRLATGDAPTFASMAAMWSPPMLPSALRPHCHSSSSSVASARDFTLISPEWRNIAFELKS